MDSIVVTVLLCLLSVVFGTGKNTLSKQVSAVSQAPEHIHFVNIFSMAAAAVGLAIYSWATGNFAHVTGYTVGFAALYAILSLLSQILLLLAMNCGSVAFSSLIYACGFIPSTFLSMWYYQEAVRPGQIIGIVILVGSMYLCLAPARGSKATFSLRWLVYCLCAFCVTGLVGFLQKYHQNGADKDALPSMLVFVFCLNLLCSALLYLGIHLVQRRRAQRAATQAEAPAVYTAPRTWPFYVKAVALGIIFAVQNLNNTYLSGVLPSAIFFPILNGSIILCTALCAALMFGERMSRRQQIGFFIGVAAMILVGIS